MTTILEIAEKIVAEGPICDHCLGRQFAKLSTGLSNDERGRSVKLTLAMDADRRLKDNGDDALLTEMAPSSIHAQKTLAKENKTEIDGEPAVEKCWVCLDIFKNLDFWADMAIEKLQGIEYETFLAGTKLSGLLSENEEILWEQAGTAYAEQLKSELNREIGKIISQKTGKTVAFSNPDVMVTFDIAKKEADLNIRSIYIYGRYQKKVRGIPQTKWPCRNCHGKGCDSCNGTGKQYPESVGELAGYPLWKAANSEDVVFHGAGREDIDALMLGTGRPFVLEAKAPQIRTLDLTALEKEINAYAAGKVEVSKLTLCGKDMVEKLKTEKATKTYRLKIKFEAPVTNDALTAVLKELEGKEINQNTPNRVKHRRADLCRNRTVHTAELERTETEGSFDVAWVKIHCDGGLYVKELTSSDEGRTVPSISGLLGIGAKVDELDVINVDIQDIE
ncbi:tRNA pseudouridine(54/55) synthase Pus10 [Methanimicrococcus blatticola]|uniref:tRNA pseudouridine synthase Pus10 n=1 Tax=Methanimicrococcus blatticola TaxID=91560 RepID=A0A484F4X0_9EURY|nr:tRNA pseudouridine(54/55) synthase Pus10 [Methanimicrococcus blatticola]MBZ3935256.1 tRNA pseudouridine(54/55) synthase Pus10 [Methanimicrococcus blatticola]MCC2508646.1 tRNA pseudouridine(54/55) synthase Pus10 [Methanimicrococcus blatticola]TDQ67952.1 tRNA pseudouridine synthase 10 [Methanimicrococcus blatticola]